MKTRNKILSGAAALLIGSGVVMAGGWGGHHGGGHGFGMGGMHQGKSLEHAVDRLAKHLDLSESQRQELSQIVDQHRGQLREGRLSGRSMRLSAMTLDPTAADYDARVESLVAEVSELAETQARLMATIYRDIAGVLDADQMNELREMMEWRMKKMNRRMEKARQQS